MKKLMFIALLGAASLCGRAEVRFQSLDNMHGTNIVLVDNNAHKDPKITDVVFENAGVRYPAEAVRCNLGDSVAVYELKFERLTYFKDSKVHMKLNGRRVTVNIHKGVE